MRNTLVLLASALFAKANSHSTQQVLGSLDLLGNTYKCESGVKPSVQCVDPSAQPSCACTCSNGITFNNNLSLSQAMSGPSYNTCHNEKDQCLQREQELTSQINDAQHARLSCEEKSASDLRAAQQAHLNREQQLTTQVDEAQQARLACEEKAATSLHTAQQAHLSREQQLTTQLTDAQQARSQCETKASADLRIAQAAHLKREGELNAKLAEYQRKAFNYNGCYVDSIPRVLSEYNVSEAGMTPQRCATLCQNYTHYGVQWANECWCGNTFKAPTRKVDGKECTQKCAGDAGQVCGGSMRLSLYSKTT